MQDETTVEGCPESGLCHLHNSEVERRRSHSDELSAVNGRICELLTFKNKLIGFAAGIGIFSTVVILGSYTYTYTHIQAADNEYVKIGAAAQRIKDENDLLRRDFNDMKISLARTDERYLALQNQLRSIDSRLEQLLTKLNGSK